MSAVVLGALLALVITAGTLLSQAGYLTGGPYPRQLGWWAQLVNNELTWGVRVQWDRYGVQKIYRPRVRWHAPFLSWPGTLRITFRALTICIYTGSRRNNGTHQDK